MESADEFSTYLIVNSTKGLIASDRIVVCWSKYKGATYINIANYIHGDTIILNTPLGKTFGGNDTYPAGGHYKGNNLLFKLQVCK